MARSKNESIHNWKNTGEVDLGVSRFFVYACKRCGVEVRNGQPLSEVGGMECKVTS